MRDEEINRKKSVLKIQSEIRNILGEELRKKDFIEISPVILSPITDPLNNPISPTNINCYGKKYCITQSMIFHKQMALKTLEKIFVFSPNVRLETLDRKDTGRHLFEFTQLDLEVKDAKREDVMSLAEDLLISVIKKMINRKIIKSFTVVTNYKEIGFHSKVFIFISFLPKSDISQRELAKRISKLPGVFEVHIISGEYDLLIKVRGTSLEKIGKLVIDKLRSIDGVGRTLTCACFETVKEEI